MQDLKNNPTGRTLKITKAEYEGVDLGKPLVSVDTRDAELRALAVFQEELDANPELRAQFEKFMAQKHRAVTNTAAAKRKALRKSMGKKRK